MSKKEFKKQCEALEKCGYTLIIYEPMRKYAVYGKGTLTQVVGK